MYQTLMMPSYIFLLLCPMYLLIKNSIHPMVMLFMLILFTLSSAIFMSKWFYSYFLSYLMFMVFIGGVLITFMYLVSLTNKDKFDIKLQMSQKIIFFSVIFLTLLMILPFMINSFNSIITNFTLETFKFSNTPINNHNYMSALTLYYTSYKMTLILTMLLLFILISVVKVCSKHSGPLRQIKK